MITNKEAEDALLAEMLERHAEREKTGDKTDRLIVPSDSIEEIRIRIERAAALSPSAILRVGERFLKETNPKLN